MKKSMIAVALATAVSMTGCMEDDPNKRAKIGAAIGAAAGMVVGNNVGDGSQTNRIVGAVVGAVAGGAVGHYMDKQAAELRNALLDELAADYATIERIDADTIKVSLSSEASFSVDSSTLKSTMKPALNRVAGVMNRYDKTIVGAAFGGESGDGEMLQAALKWKLSENWLLDLYVDHEKRPGPSDITSGQLFAGYESERTAFGAQYLYRDRDEDAPAKLASIFLDRRFSQEFRGIGRIDRIFSPSLKGDNISYVPFDPNAPATMYLAGLEYQVSEHLYFTPNTIVISYDRNEGVRPETDLFLRLTFFVNFE